MSEAIILYRGRGGVDPESLKPQTITSNGTYKAPVTGNYWVAVVGGGGGGGGGCRNSWNVSQVFYGAGGTRGTLNAGNVYLNAGDEVSVTLGAGGTAGVNNTTVVSNNSRGTNGGTGGTSVFGSHRSGAGGTGGNWSQSWHYWRNTISGWNNYFSNLSQKDRVWTLGTVTRTEFWGYDINGKEVWNEWGYGPIVYGYWYSNMVAIPDNTIYINVKVSGSYTPVGSNVYYCGFAVWYGAWSGFWYNNPIWNNQIANTTTRCYTSIQQGTWWYLNNNQVSTSGTRAYRSDGGASGSAGNAGFVVIVPPTI